jgi:hypothetical protein
MGSSEEEIRLQLELWEKSLEQLNETEVGLQNFDDDNGTQTEEASLESLNSSAVPQPLTEHSEVLILLTDFTNLIHLLLLVNPVSQQQYPDIWRSDLLAGVQPQDNFAEIFHKLEAYNRAHQSENYFVDNQGHYIWAPYSLVKAIHRAIAVEEQLAREGVVTMGPPRFKLINPGVPIVATIRKRTRCGEDSRAHEKLKKTEEEFLNLTNKGGCQCEKGVTVVASKLS